MIKSARKIPILRYGLIVVLIFILFSGAFYLYVSYNSARKLQHNIDKLITARANSELIDSCLFNLYSADNNSRLYAVTNDKKYAHLFSGEISHLSGLLSKIKDGNIRFTGIASDSLKRLIVEKAVKTNNYIKLRLLTDSLILLSTKMDSMLAYSRVKIPATVIKTTKTVTHVDTIKPQDAPPATAPKKRLLGRIFSVFSNKNKQQAAMPAAALIVKRDTQTNTVVNTGTVYTPVSKSVKRYYKKLYVANSRLRINEHAILLINSNLVTDIIAELKRYKTIEMAYSEESKAQLAGKVTDVFKEYSALSKLTLIALILLFTAVLYNIWKIFANERDLIKYSEKAEEYANNKSNFMASMSHEIRTPINSVIGFSEQLSMSKLTAEQTVQINAIRNSSQMLLDVVNEILDFSKYETGKMSFEQQPFMVKQALNDAFSSVTIQAARNGLTLRKSILIDNDVCFSGDVIRLKQVIMNLLVNAIKFTVEGEVFLQAMLVEAPAGKMILKVRVKDTGIGIEKKNLPLIFDEFSQVDEAQKVTRHKGTGLGLAICKKIVELQGGKIRVISEPGKGSVFAFEIPFDLADPSLCAAEQPVQDSELAKQVMGAHILLAEDNQLNVLLAKTILKKWNITCDIAYNGREAIELFEDKKYDLVLTDIEMPVMGGLELLALIRNNPATFKAETPVIVLTANVMQDDRDRYLLAGATDIELKPFSERGLIKKISMALKTKYANIDALLFKAQ